MCWAALGVWLIVVGLCGLLWFYILTHASDFVKKEACTHAWHYSYRPSGSPSEVWVCGSCGKEIPL